MDFATGHARSFGRRSSTLATSRHHKRNLGSFSGVSLVAISHKMIPKLLTIGILLVGGGTKQLQQRRTGGREALLGLRAKSLQQEGGAPPLLLVAVLYRQRFTGASPAPSPTPLMPFCHQPLPLMRCCSSWRATSCRGVEGAATCLLLPLGVQLAVGAVGHRVLVFSHPRREPPGRDVWCVSVRCVRSSDKKLIHSKQAENLMNANIV
ncbi:hypothetical protein NDU88_008625 [Pleurodeles waltl]|uniref:Uncharacterized protein n=1 Tax=Pleurodeles waltl TaxID=8319 RepID=A0AAV7RY74_PLEWA|nr:hypothetical protein NDU88_008625 [Pleurodeles waltl]